MTTALFESLDCRTYLNAGELDPTFAAAQSPGLTVTQVAGQSASLFRTVAVYPDGRILAAGQTFVSTFAGTQSERVLLARFTADGTPDLTFGTDGIVNNSPRGQNDIDRIAIADLANRVVILHAKPDNFGNVPVGTADDQYTPGKDALAKTQATGNASDRIACGVIRVGK